jgi:uncharacterized coiled-coil protein SlyX
MTDLTKKLDEIAAKKKTDTQVAATLLLQLQQETNDNTKIAYYLMKIKTSPKGHVSLHFFEGLAKASKLSGVKELHDQILITEAYKGNIKSPTFASRLFIMIAVLIKQEHEYAREALAHTLSDIEKDGAVSDAMVKEFKKFVVDYCGFEMLEKFGEQEWDNPAARNRFNRMMQSLNDSKATIVSLPKDSTTVSKSDLSEKKPIKTATVEDCNREVSKLYLTLTELNSTYSPLLEQIKERDVRIAELKSQLQQRDQKIVTLNAEVDNAQSIQDELQGKISNLTERLKTSMQMDSISQSQETITLKKDLASALKIDYNDFLYDKDSECNLDSFEAFKIILERVFKKLNRFGITTINEGE